MSKPKAKIAKTDATKTINSTVISLLLLNGLCQRVGERSTKATDGLYHVADMQGVVAGLGGAVRQVHAAVAVVEENE